MTTPAPLEPGAAALGARLTAQLLAGPPAATPERVAERLLAVQAQDGRGARLAVRARTKGLTAGHVDEALDERRLVVTWCNRGTLHLIRSEDYAWLHALTTPPLHAVARRRLGQEGVAPHDAERAVVAVERALAAEGPLTREELASRIERLGVRTHGQALVHILLLASVRGIAVRGPMAGARQAYALTRDWLGEPKPVDRGRALAELARRYLAGHGPAAPRDLARWAGLPLRDARAGLQAIAGRLAQSPDGLVDLAGRAPAAPLPPPRLLGPFEPVLLGWESRAPLLGDHEDSVIAGGIFRGFALVDGQAAATWKWVRGAVELRPFAPLGTRQRTALDSEAADVARFLGARARP